MGDIETILVFLEKLDPDLYKKVVMVEDYNDKRSIIIDEFKKKTLENISDNVKACINGRVCNFFNNSNRQPYDRIKRRK